MWLLLRSGNEEESPAELEKAQNTQEMVKRGGGNEEYWQRMKSGWLTWKVNVCSVKVLMDWAALPFVCLHVCVCAREGRMVNAIVFAHVSVWTVTSRSMNMHACVHDILSAERLITPGWVIDVWSDWVLHPYELCTKMSCAKRKPKQTNKQTNKQKR